MCPILDAPASTAPAYLRIADSLRRQIRSGDLAGGCALPPERELAVEHGVSRMTARRALSVLEAEGLVLRDGTRGTFVAKSRLSLRVGSFSREVERGGGHAGAEVVWAREQPAGSTVAEAFDLDASERVYAIQRVRWWDGEPVAVETTYYPVALIPGFLDGDLLGSLWDRLSEHGVLLHVATATVEVVALDADIAPLLGARQGASGLRLSRRTLDKSGACVEYANDLYRADRIALTIDRNL